MTLLLLRQCHGALRARLGLRGGAALSGSARDSYISRRSVATATAKSTSRGSRMKYVTSDEIDARLLEGLTSASDETRPVNLVQDKESAMRVLEKIRELGPDHFHACDTEVAQIDIKAVGPVGNGKVRRRPVCTGQ